MLRRPASLPPEPHLTSSGRLRHRVHLAIEPKGPIAETDASGRSHRHLLPPGDGQDKDRDRGESEMVAEPGNLNTMAMAADVHPA